MTPDRRWLLWIGRLNFWLFQWFGFRVFGEYKVANLESDDARRVGWGVLFPVLPLTGWDFFGWRTRFWPRHTRPFRLG